MNLSTDVSLFTLITRKLGTKYAARRQALCVHPTFPALDYIYLSIICVLKSSHKYLLGQVSIYIWLLCKTAPPPHTQSCSPGNRGLGA